MKRNKMRVRYKLPWYKKIFGYPEYFEYTVVRDGKELWLKDFMGAWVRPITNIELKRYYDAQSSSLLAKQNDG